MFSYFTKPRFPPVDSAGPDGMVLVGGRLNPKWILAAYPQGIFPWPIDTDMGHVLAWFSPDPRAILEFDSLHVSQRLARRMRSGVFRVTVNTAFEAVIAACAEPRGEHDGTWITPQLSHAYRELHQLGHAHSVEVWQGERLVGGLYGLAIGGYFSAESMFHRTTDASKVAIAHLVQHLQARGFALLDVQVPSSHLTSLGATAIPRSAFLARLQTAITLPVTS